MKKHYYLLLLLLVYKISFAQDLSNFKSKQFLVKDTLFLDSLSIVPYSVIIYDENKKIVPASQYKVELSHSQIIFTKKPKNDSVQISYRVFPINFTKKYTGLVQSSWSNSDTTKKAIVYIPHSYTKEEQQNKTDQLQKSGYISRGINFGNNQDVVVNSALNMQLSGRLSNDIQIRAAITDNNIPIQPDGNTQQIQEFDKVYINLYNKYNSLTLGDFIIKKPKGYFLNTHKKVMGGNIQSQINLKNEKTLKIETTAAVAKGKFHRMNFSGQEGIQGPYKLRGANNESFIIVLAGSEKVYINGELMLRGDNNDYTIDYNLSEITFTAKRLIDKDSRIVVEFEYSDKNYAKFTVGNFIEFNSKKQSFWLNILSDHESKNQTLNADYSDKEKNILFLAGDDPYKAASNSFDSLAYSANEIRYKMIDSLSYDSIFVYSTNENDAFYRVNFALVGEGNGDYVQTVSSANGRVFKWVAPIGGVHQGNYLPIKILITPKSQQMISTGGNIRLKSYTGIDYEYALSRYDANTFSPKDAQDDIGMGFKMRIFQDILTKDTSEQKIRASLNFESVQKNFKYFENFRSVEFNRDWNISDNINQQNSIVSGDILWENKNWGFLNYQLKMMEIDKEYQAYKNEFIGNISKKRIKLKTNGSYLESESTLNGNSIFYRSKSEASFDAHYLIIGLNEETENNQYFVLKDSLLNKSYAFTQWGAFIKNTDEKKNKFKLSYTERADLGAKNMQLQAANKSQTFSLDNEIVQLKNQVLRNTFSWRKVTIEDSLLSKIPKEEETFIGKLDHHMKFLKNAISFRTYYELGTGLELKKEFAYIEVAPGQGVFQWIDYNNNKIQELNEFEKATYSDQAKYIRVFVPTNEYIKAYSNKFTESIHLYPYKIWRNKSGIRGFIARFNNLFSYKISRKNKNVDIIQNLNSFDNQLSDSSLLRMNHAVRNNLSFNKINPIWGIDYTFLNYNNKSLLINGFDIRENKSNSLNFRLTIKEDFRIDNFLEKIAKTYHSDFFATNNYAIDQWGDKTQISLQANNNLRISSYYQYKEKRNTLSFQKAILNQIGLEIKYSQSGKSNLSIKIDYFNFKYNDVSNSPVAFEMLEGLLPGNNGRWTVLYQINISKYLQLNLNYMGRVAQDDKVIHNAQAQLRAVF